MKFQMNHRALMRLVYFLPFVLLSLMLASKWGVHEKMFWQKYMDILMSSGSGMIIGAVTALTIGGIGITLMGTGFGVGVLGMTMIGGGLGVGCGGLIHMARHPSDFLFNWTVILPVLVAGTLLGSSVSRRMRDFFLPLDLSLKPAGVPAEAHKNGQARPGDLDGVRA
ncbi:MAG: hypothetical protein NTY38_28340 [Acidobacteria bacterium]|nr:hypothetical protein [Acidobacteriota bacterium]